LDDLNLEQFLLSGGGRQNDMPAFNTYLNEIEIQQIQMMAWDFFSAYKMGDDRRCTVILQIILSITKTRQPQLPTLQQYFKGRKIGRYRNRISTKMAAEYIAFIAAEVRKMSDWRVQPQPIQ
jgi:hypothetical protein